MFSVYPPYIPPSDLQLWRRSTLEGAAVNSKWEKVARLVIDGLRWPLFSVSWGAHNNLIAVAAGDRTIRWVIVVCALFLRDWLFFLRFYVTYRKLSGVLEFSLAFTHVYWGHHFFAFRLFSVEKSEGSESFVPQYTIRAHDGDVNCVAWSVCLFVILRVTLDGVLFTCICMSSNLWRIHILLGDWLVTFSWTYFKHFFLLQESRWQPSSGECLRRWNATIV